MQCYETYLSVEQTTLGDAMTMLVDHRYPFQPAIKLAGTSEILTCLWPAVIFKILRYTKQIVEV